MRTPYEHSKGYFENAYADVNVLTEESLMRCCDELSKTVRDESTRIGILLSLDKKEVVKAEGAGLDVLGYRTSEFQWFSVLQCIPPIYDWILTLYFIRALENINKKSLAHLKNKCYFSITVPMSSKNKKKFYRAHIRAWVLEFQKPEKPVIVQVVIDLNEVWNFPDDSPIRAVGEMNGSTFSMEDINKEMKAFISTTILSDPQYFGLHATEVRVIRGLLRGDTPEKLAREMKTKKHNVLAYKRKIKKVCNQKLGFLSEAKQWANFLDQMFDLDALNS